MPGLQHEGAGAVQIIGATNKVVAGNDAGDVADVVVLADEGETSRLRAAAGGCEHAWPGNCPIDVVGGLDPRRLVQCQAATQVSSGVDGVDVLAGRNHDRVGIVGVQGLGQVGRYQPERTDVAGAIAAITCLAEAKRADILCRRRAGILHRKRWREADRLCRDEIDRANIVAGLGRNGNEIGSGGAGEVHIALERNQLERRRQQQANGWWPVTTMSEQPGDVGCAVGGLVVNIDGQGRHVPGGAGQRDAAAGTVGRKVLVPGGLVVARHGAIWRTKIEIARK